VPLDPAYKAGLTGHVPATAYLSKIKFSPRSRRERGPPHPHPSPPPEGEENRCVPLLQGKGIVVFLSLKGREMLLFLPLQGGG